MTDPSPGSAVAAVLKAASGVIALVNTRVFPGPRPVGETFPHLTYWRVPGFPRNSAMGADVPSVCARIQVDAWAKKYGEAQDASRAARRALQRYSGTIAGTVVEDIYIDSDGDGPREPESAIYHCMLDLRVWYRE